MWNPSKTARLIFAALLLLLVGNPAAFALPWYIVNSSETLYDYQDGSGAAVNPRPINVDPAAVYIVGIDVGPGNVLYGLTGTNFNSLYTINPANGNATLVGSTGVSSIIEGDIGFDPTTNTLYGVYTLSGADDRALYTINTNNGAATFVTNFTAGDPSGLSFDSSGNLWVLDRNNNNTGNWRLLQVNKTTGVTNQSFTTNLASPGLDTLGMDFDNSNNLYVAMDDGFFYSVDTSNGMMTAIDTHGAGDVTALALVPEPSTLALAACVPALLLCGWAVRRRLRAK